jgi:hypothetical protein
MRKTEPPEGRYPHPAAKERPLRKRPEYRPLHQGVLLLKVDDNPLLIVSAKQLVLLLAGRWWEGCDHGSARCPLCRKPGLLVSQCNGVGISLYCREGCAPAAIHKALRSIGLATGELWL